MCTRSSSTSTSMAATSCPGSSTCTPTSCCILMTRRAGTSRYSRSRWGSGRRGRWPRQRGRSKRASRRSGSWAPRALAMPMSGCVTRWQVGLFPGRRSSPQPGRWSPPARMGRPGSIRGGRSPRAPRWWTDPMPFAGRSVSRSPPAPTGSRFTPTTGGDRAFRRRRPSHLPSWRRPWTKRGAPGSGSRPTPRPMRGSAVRSKQASGPSSTARTLPPRRWP